MIFLGLIRKNNKTKRGMAQIVRTRSHTSFDEKATNPDRITVIINAKGLLSKILIFNNHLKKGSTLVFKLASLGNNEIERAGHNLEIYVFCTFDFAVNADWNGGVKLHYEVRNAAVFYVFHRLG